LAIQDHFALLVTWQSQFQHPQVPSE
jgi:hypothetical protein